MSKPEIVSVGPWRRDLVSLLADESIRRWQPPDEQTLLRSTPLSIQRPQTDDELADFFLDTLGVRFEDQTPSIQPHEQLDDCVLGRLV